MERQSVVGANALLALADLTPLCLARSRWRLSAGQVIVVGGRSCVVLWWSVTALPGVLWALLVLTRGWIGSLISSLFCSLHVLLNPFPPIKYCTHYTACQLSGFLSNMVMSRLCWKTNLFQASAQPPLIGAVHLAGAEIGKTNLSYTALRVEPCNDSGACCFPLSSHPATDICMFHPRRMVYLEQLILLRQNLVHLLSGMFFPSNPNPAGLLICWF